MNITEFLLARIAEDEAVARAAGGTWNLESHPTPEPQPMAVARLKPEFQIVAMAGDQPVDLQHIARQDPGRVLAECEAKRRIVEMCRPTYAVVYRESERLLAHAFDQQTMSAEAWSDALWPFTEAESILKHLALPYADDPDYDEAWRL